MDLLALKSSHVRSLAYLLACLVSNVIETVQIVHVDETVEHIVCNDLALMHLSLGSAASLGQSWWLNSPLVALHG